MRYATTKHDRICSISSEPFQCSKDFKLIQIPSELSHVTSKDLILNGRVKKGRIVGKFVKKPAKQMKIAFVGNWKMKCGIATYAENLWSKIIPHVGDYKLFVENNTITTGPLNQIGNKTIDPSKVVPCWKRGESLKTLVEEIKDYDPDVVFIRHEFGLWPNAA